MNEKQEEAVKNALVNYVVRVSNGDYADEKELEILPAIVSELMKITYI